MRMSKANYDRLMFRDGGACLHCGTDTGLVPQHRMNRGMGGSIFLDMPSNLVLMCSGFNGDMEADAAAAMVAIANGWKIARFYSEDLMGRIMGEPVFDRNTRLWYHLDNDWNRNVTDSAY